MAQEIKSIIFDIGGVVIKPHDPVYYAYLARKSGRTEAEVSYMMKRLQPESEIGRMSIPMLESIIAKQLKIPKKEIRWLDFFKKHMEVNVDITDLIGELHSDFQLAYLSNIDKAKYLWADRILRPIPFDYRFASCNIGLRKPDPKIYRYVLKKMKAKPEETIFIDNMLENVLGATRVGINSILFKNRMELDIHLSKIIET
jgi:glucose-1-phosphatase